MGQARLHGLSLMYIDNDISISDGAIIKKFAATSCKIELQFFEAILCYNNCKQFLTLVVNLFQINCYDQLLFFFFDWEFSFLKSNYNCDKPNFVVFIYFLTNFWSSLNHFSVYAPDSNSNLFIFFYKRSICIIDNGVSRRRTRNARFRARRADHSTTSMCILIFFYK